MSDRVDITRVPGLALDPAALLSRVQQVLDADPYWFPVRHCSPTVALHVRAAIRARSPRLVLIEGPAEATHLIPHLLDRKTRPPVAIYSCHRADDDASEDRARSSVWYPLLPYSPELVAIMAAQEVGAECAFIDLPHHALIRPHRPAEGDPTEERGSEGLNEGSDIYQR